MGKRNTLLLLTICVYIFCGFNLSSKVGDQIKSPDYWVWAGVDLRLISEVVHSTSLYLHQGHFDVSKGKVRFRKLGLFPHPLENSIYLVYRIKGGLPESNQILEVFQRHVLSWERQGVIVKGIQLDFDSPTSKLLEYGNFLENLRGQIPSQYQLSITGLGDWALNGDSASLKKMSQSVDEIVFQLYQGRSHFSNIDGYVTALSRLKIPFKIGLLYNQEGEDIEEKLKNIPSYTGSIIFVQNWLL